MQFLNYWLSVMAVGSSVAAVPPLPELPKDDSPQTPIKGYVPPADILTATYASQFNRPEIKILDTDSQVKWSWGMADIEQGEIGFGLRMCLRRGPNAVEVKWMEGGKHIAALWGDTALIINHTPENPEEDKKIVFGVCTYGMMSSAHTLETLPNRLLAIATTGQTADDGFWIFDTSVGLVRNPKPVQKVANIPAVHALVWDEQEQTLWAAGNDKAADGSQGESHGILNGYIYNSYSRRHPLEPWPSRRYTLPTARQCTVEWGEGTYDGRYWDGPHDLVPLPNQRKFLITSDLDIHSFDIATGTFDCCESVVEEHLGGFVPVGDRTGKDEDGEVVMLPRSDLKSLSVAADGKSVLYNQAVWHTYLGKYVNYMVDGEMMPMIDPGVGGVYRARWFAGVPGWPVAW